MRINKIYLDRFTKTKYGYTYPVKNGVYLSFDLNTLEYKNVITYYNSFYSIDKEINELLNNLIKFDFLEISAD